METSASHVVKANNFCSPLFIPKSTKCTSLSIWESSSSSSRPNQGRLRLSEQSWSNRRGVEKVVKCAKGGTKLGDEIITEEELTGLGRFGLGDKCKESRGITELLECLEREAIMGEDEGKEPTDYNRRAQIFDKSSRVFQALKEISTSTTPLA